MLARVQSARPVGCGSSARASSGAFLGQHSHGTQFMALLLQVIVLCIDGGVLRLGKQICARVRFFLPSSMAPGWLRYTPREGCAAVSLCVVRRPVRDPRS